MIIFQYLLAISSDADYICAHAYEVVAQVYQLGRILGAAGGAGEFAVFACQFGHTLAGLLEQRIVEIERVAYALTEIGRAGIYLAPSSRPYAPSALPPSMGRLPTGWNLV